MVFTASINDLNHCLLNVTSILFNELLSLKVLIGGFLCFLHFEPEMRIILKENSWPIYPLLKTPHLNRLD